MLSIANVDSGSKAASYYEQSDDYYSSDRSPSVWSGKAASALGLSGEVAASAFRDLLAGDLPNGAHIHNAAAGRRGGTDLTFSAPKSISLQALAGGDTRLLEAHETAVSRALAYVETLASCRVTEHGTTVRSATENLAIAQFRHDLSRAADPQLHTHCVVLNVTQRGDGQWRALDNEAIYRHKMFLGALYRSELAREVKALGYEVRITHGDGRFELAHLGPEQLRIFSQRSKAIEDELGRRGLTRESATAQQRQAVALQTREAKQQVDRGELRAAWRDRARQAGLEIEGRPPPRSSTDAWMEDRQRTDGAARAVAYASLHLMEREAVVSRLDLERVALERGVGTTSLSAIRQEIETAVQSGALLIQSAINSTGRSTSPGDVLTTPGAREREREILALEASGRGALNALMTPGDARDALALTQLGDDQRNAVEAALTGSDRVSGIQGRAGAGKTSTLRALHQLVVPLGIRPMGVAPSRGAALELGQTGIPSQTLASLAVRGFAGLDHRTLLVVDEAGMVGAGDMRDLLKAAANAKARVLLVGDTQQLKAVAAGRPFAQLQHAGMPTVRLREIQRQRNPQLKAAVELAADGRVAASVEHMRRHVVEQSVHEERHDRIAADYAGLAPDTRARTLIVSGTHVARESINSSVREALGLSGKGVAVTTLRTKDLTRAERARTVSYQPGDVVRADRPYKSLGMAVGDFARVVDGRAGVVTLQLASGREVEWRPPNQPYVSCFTETERELAAGDIVRFNHNDRRTRIVNGERATVAAINREAGSIVLDRHDGSRLVLPASGPLHLEHGYAQTVHSAQGQTCERVLIDAPVTSATTHESAYYVAISRATHSATLYTDDASRLPEALSRSDSKTAALDLQPDGRGSERLEATLAG